MKTQGILPRSEVTMEVRCCQCAHHCRVQMQSPNAQPSDVKLVEHVAGSCDAAGTEWRCAVRCRMFVSLSMSAKMCTKTVTASAFGWNGVGFTEQCPWLREFDQCEGAGEARRCDYICFHITIVGWETTLKSGNRRSEALVVAPRRSTDKPRTLLFTCKKVVRRARYAREK